jgi:hypothetical protein
MTFPRRFEYTKEVDRRILELVTQHGKKWRMISGELGGGITDDAIRNRYMRLNGQTPRPWSARCVTQSRTRRYWTEEEDERLAQAIEKYGLKWNHIQETEFPEKSRQAIRNRADRMGLKLLYLIASTVDL